MPKQKPEESLRAFIALDLPEHLKRSFKDFQDSLKAEGLSFRWVSPQNLHVTLKFLGEINKDLLPLLDKSVSDVCRQSKSFLLDLKRVGSFRRKGGSAVIWAGIDNAHHLVTLQNKVEEVLVSLGFPKEGRFSPHLTLGRTKQLEDRIHFSQILEKYGDLNFGTIEVNALSLVKSDLKSEGPVYTELSHYLFTEET